MTKTIIHTQPRFTRLEEAMREFKRAEQVFTTFEKRRDEDNRAPGEEFKDAQSDLVAASEELEKATRQARNFGTDAYHIAQRLK